MNKPASKLVVEDLHLQYGDNPILKGVSMTLTPGRGGGAAGRFRQRQDDAAALGCRSRAAEPRDGSRSATRCSSTAPAVSTCPWKSATSGLVFQSYALWPHRTVFENVAYGLRLRGIPAQ